jgi:hypothetical protein
LAFTEPFYLSTRHGSLFRPGRIIFRDSTILYFLPTRFIFRRFTIFYFLPSRFIVRRFTIVYFDRAALSFDASRSFISTEPHHLSELHDRLVFTEPHYLSEFHGSLFFARTPFDLKR